ncbi:hypothetical protein T552_01884 [Pneumocystis carinii B80]|uniref:Uncharacterized protein n=1 Tax=Pneumocystis carinii (strain B80) TaxID=1408658 RepID=A0A0W4ZI17_PNEC8|nr:hypothetical protein T552_01884 [Pneumocystis carinii B80]KTW28022.1 hypothetical protein T552_01884 [Pneumocystis carinii B80]
MNILDKVISKLLKLSKNCAFQEKNNYNIEDKTSSKDSEISDLMHFNEKSPEINIKHAKHRRFTANKKNTFMLTLDTLININFPLKEL